MQLLPRVFWTIEGERDPLEPRLLALLSGIAEHGTLSAACVAAGVPYRSAWGVVREAGRRLRTPLVTLERGRGAALSPAGQALLRADTLARRRVGDVSLKLADPAAAPQTSSLRIAASHDLALAQLRDALPDSGTLRVDLAFMGSQAALEAYARKDADMAGFHFPVDALDTGTARLLRRTLKAGRDRVIGFATREQGLILPPRNPRRVKSLRDIAEKRLRFVNRQPGSGTRLLVDAMLARADLRPGGIAGYESAERNHIAVAAAVAAGHADVGVGLRAAAAEFGLAFVPLARERYVFAVRAAALDSPSVCAFVDLLRGPLLRRAGRHLPGYRFESSGVVEPIPVPPDTRNDLS